MRVEKLKIRKGPSDWNSYVDSQKCRVNIEPDDRSKILQNQSPVLKLERNSSSGVMMHQGVPYNSPRPNPTVKDKNEVINGKPDGA